MTLANIEGSKVPVVTFPLRVGDEWIKRTTDDIFANKTVIVFSLPGAFTPTCSSTHLPRYNELASVFKAHGVDDIVCMSVNDTFVMNKWAEDQGLKNVKVIPDGSAKFTASMGMDVQKDNLGFGVRSWRYAVIVKNFEIEQGFVERGFTQNAMDDPYGVSSPQNILAFLEGREYDAGGEALTLNLSDGIGSEDKLG